MSHQVEFWSSTEYTTFLPALVRALEAEGVNAGHRFQVSQPDYWAARGRLARFALRARCYGIYPARIAARFVRRGDRPVIGVVCTNTFFAPWVAMTAAGRRGIPVVNWVFDLFPDVLLVAGKLRAGSLAERFLRRWVRVTFDRAAANVFLGEHLRAHAEARFGPVPRATVIPVGADGTPFRGREPSARERGTPATILYCGNLGRMHDVDTIIGAIRRGLPEWVRMEFRGNGAGFRTLDAAVGGAGGNVVLGGNIEGSAWVEAMAAADVALVTLRPGAEGLVMPSKTYSAMVAGQAILAVCPKHSDLADTVLRHDAGWVVEPGDIEALSRVIAHIATDPDEVLRCRTNSYRAGHDSYDQRVLAKEWIKLLSSMASISTDS